MPLSVGERLGPYEILGRIGEGGMGEVWKARDTRLGRIVALKISKTQFTERFEREARAAAALNHPYICQLHDIGPNYLVLEFVEGTPLKGPLPLDKAVEYAGQILEALDTAHRAHQNAGQVFRYAVATGRARDIATRIVRDVRTFEGERGPADDITVLVAKRVPAGPA